MSDTSATKAPPTSLLDGRRVLLIICSFFGVIFTVNGYFAYRAISTYTGEVASEPFSQGLAYNSRIAAFERQTQLGWRERAAVERDGKVAVSIVDASGVAIGDLALSGMVGRPSTNKDDRRLAFRPDGVGTYVAQTTALGAGTWILTVEARGGETASQALYRSRRRVWLTP